MNDEIKEILNGLQEDIDINALIEVRGKYFEPLLDYITNLQQELQRKDNIINEIKKEINEQLEEYEKGKEVYKYYGSLEDYTRGLRNAYISILDKIKDLENGRSDE